jgi:ATP-dependent Clp protease ATP-binding subunit ClpC
MFDRFTERARSVVARAREVALARGHDWVEPAHVVLGALEDPKTHAATVLAALGHDVAALRAALDAVAPVRGPVLEIEGQLPFTVAARRMLEASLQAAASLSCPYIGTEHVLLGLLETEDLPAGKALREAGVDPQAIRAELEKAGALRPTGWRAGFDLGRVCAEAMRRVTDAGLDRVGRAAMVASLVADIDPATARALRGLGIEPAAFLEALEREIREDAAP